MNSIKLIGGALAVTLTTLTLASPARADDDKDRALQRLGEEATKTYEIDWAKHKNEWNATAPWEPKHCLDWVELAKKQGVQPGDMVPLWRPIAGATKKGDESFIALSAIERMCTAQNNKVKAFDASIWAFHMNMEIERMLKQGTPNEGALITIMNEAKNCSEAMAEALAKGAPKEIPLLYTDGVTLGEADAKVCHSVNKAVAEAKAKRAAAEKAAHDAAVAPFKKLMKGDKLALIEQYDLYEDDTEIYGRGGYVIHTPEELKKAKVWFMQFGNDTDSHGRPRWHLRRWQFRGDKLVKQKELHGRGEEAPDRSYR